MRAKITLAIALLSCGSMAVGVIACGSSSKPDAGDGVDGSVDMPDTGVAMDTGVDTGIGDSGPNCTKADGGGNGCRACCQMENPNGALFFQSAIHICVCQNNSALCPSCANNYCAQNPMLPSQSCGQCAYNTLLADGGACFGPVGQACGGNKDCLAWFQCQAKCPP